MPHLVATLMYLSQNYSYHKRGDRSPLVLVYYYYLKRYGVQFYRGGGLTYMTYEILPIYHFVIAK